MENCSFVLAGAEFHDEQIYRQGRVNAALFDSNVILGACQPIELPIGVARAFVKDMRAFFAEEDTIKADAIAAGQLHARRAYQGPRDKKLKLTDVKKMFLEMRDQA